MPLPVSVALGAINWALLLREAPKIVRDARQLYEFVGKNRLAAKTLDNADVNDLSEVGEDLNELRLKVYELEAQNARQTELISQLAAQGEALSQGLETIAGRTTLLIWIAAVAVLVAVIAIITAVVN